MSTRPKASGAARTLLFSVTVDDCTLQHFRSGGNGGQHQNVTDSGTRIIHEPSGARGESREERSQLQNKKRAFERMAAHPLFLWWVHEECERLQGHQSLEDRVDQMLADPRQLRVEVKDVAGRWVEMPAAALDAARRIDVSGSKANIRSRAR